MMTMMMMMMILRWPAIPRNSRICSQLLMLVLMLCLVFVESNRCRDASHFMALRDHARLPIWPVPAPRCDFDVMNVRFSPIADAPFLFPLPFALAFFAFEGENARRVCPAEQVQDGPGAARASETGGLPEKESAERSQHNDSREVVKARRPNPFLGGICAAGSPFLFGRPAAGC